MYYTNERLVNLNRIFDQNKRQGYLRLDLNENPGGLPESFIKEVLEEVDQELVSQYPETLEFTEFLAGRLGTDIAHISLVNGSSEGIRNIIEAFTSPGGRIVGVTPSYAMFSVYADMYGRVFEPVTYPDNLVMTTDRIIERLDEDVQLLILVNPNNPLGNVYSDAEMDELLEAARNLDITVLVDEAYHYFSPNTVMSCALEREHVFVTRTFSKLFSLAGLRLGYVAGWPEGVELVQKLNTPHNVNALALLFARRILEREGMLDSLIQEQLDGKRWLCESLASAGYEYVTSGGNFMFIKPKTNAVDVVRRMKEEEGILIKSYDGIGSLGSCLRVTTGGQPHMVRFLDSLRRVDRV